MPTAYLGGRGRRVVVKSHPWFQSKFEANLGDDVREFSLLYHQEVAEQLDYKSLKTLQLNCTEHA